MNGQIWITVSGDSPEFEDIAKTRCQLESLGIDFEGKVGICFTRKQWSNFLHNISRFESRFVSAIPAEVMGFPVRMIALE